MSFAVRNSLLILSLLFFSNPLLGAAQNLPSNPTVSGLTVDQETNFLLTAKVIASKRESKGVTSPYRLTLSDGHLTHDASFQPIDEFLGEQDFADGTIELNFRDSYHFNIAGYQLARLLDLDSLIPVYVQRKWNGMTGSLSWHIDNVMMDENDRAQKHIAVPDPVAWNNQMYKLRIFNELIYNTDPNNTNVLVTKDWHVWLIDFTRAFRLHHSLRDPRNLVKCNRELLEKLKELNEAQVLAATKKQLSKSEVKALMARRDLIVADFQKMIAEKGEAEVLY